MDDRVAKEFLSLGIQHWGQSDVERAKATDAYLRAAGFNLKDDHEAAGKWLEGVIAKMPWGKFEREAEHLEAALTERRS